MNNTQTKKMEELLKDFFSLPFMSKEYQDANDRLNEFHDMDFLTLSADSNGVNAKYANAEEKLRYYLSGSNR